MSISHLNLGEHCPPPPPQPPSTPLFPPQCFSLGYPRGGVVAQLLGEGAAANSLSPVSPMGAGGSSSLGHSLQLVYCLGGSVEYLVFGHLFLLQCSSLSGDR